LRGIILAGGSGSRLYPATKALNKHLLPVYDKPLIYYSLSTLMLAGIRDIAVVTSPNTKSAMAELLGDGSQFGVSLTFVVQPEPLGLSDGLFRCKEFLNDQSFLMILGDNLFFSAGLTGLLSKLTEQDSDKVMSVVTVAVKDPQRFGVVESDASGAVLSIVEKPANPRSNRIVTGLYRFPSDAPNRVDSLVPSARGELEVTDLLNSYIQDGSSFEALNLPRGAVWFDAGTTESMYQASEFVKTYQEASGCLIGCPEEIAMTNRWIESEHLLSQLSGAQSDSPYARYVKRVG
jgi:glucose-1-phosphate thymidylyltransferase